MRAYIRPALILAALAMPRGASAWTEASVTGVAASVDVRQPEAARVELELHLQVRSGWLSSVDLDGLDPDLELLALDVSNAPSAPEILRPVPGQLGVRWNDRRVAPGQGEHVLRVVYATRHLYAASAGPGPRKLAWTLPRWPVGLSQVQVRVIGPAGLRATPGEPNYGEQVQSEPAQPGGDQILSYTRAELPRTESWTLRFELPPSAAIEPRSGASQVASLVGGITLVELRSFAPEACRALLGALLGAIALAKRRVRRAQRRERTALLPGLAVARFDVATFVACALAPALLDAAPSIALGCALAGLAMALERTRPPAVAAADSGEDTAHRATRSWTPEALLDATTLPGAACIATVLGAGLSAPQTLRAPALLCGWLALPLFFNVRTSQTVFLRRSSTTASRSLSSRATASGAGSKSTSAAITSS